VCKAVVEMPRGMCAFIMENTMPIAVAKATENVKRIFISGRRREM